MLTRPVALALALLLALPAAATTHRSKATRAEFQREHPCPATGSTHGGCKGFVVDHVVPLCAGGADAPSNMAWQTVADGRAKDRVERKACARH